MPAQVTTTYDTQSIQLSGKQRKVKVSSGEGVLTAGSLLFCNSTSGEYEAPDTAFANLGTPVILLEDIDATNAAVDCLVGISGEFADNKVTLLPAATTLNTAVPLGTADSTAKLVILAPQMRDFLRMFNIEVVDAQNIEV